MFSESNFIVRKSGKKEGCYYIDYQGVYKVSDLSKIVGLKLSSITEKYTSYGATYEESLEVYYFNSADEAKKAISEIVAQVKKDIKGKVVFLTDTEIEYLRKALINEGANVMHISNKIKDEIFKKLNS